MCRIERFNVVYPNGYREPREQVIPCPRGTHSHPCSRYEIARVGDRLASPSDLAAAMQPNIIPAEPRDLERPRSRHGRRDPIEGVTLNFKFCNPFSRKNKNRKEKPQYYLVRKTKKSEHPPAAIQHQPPIPIPPPFGIPSNPPDRGASPIITMIQPPDHHTTHQPPRPGPRRRRRPTAPIIHQSSEEDGDESTSPLQALREHGRRTRSLSPGSYQVQKEIIRLRELRERERRDRIEREERDARERAERAEIRERLERQREQREREEENERRRQLRQEDRELRRQRRIEEQARIQQEEDRERLRADRARRYQEEQDIERRRAAERDRLRRLRDEQARRQYAEGQRQARAREANVPRLPRHRPFVHNNEDRGERFIRNSIREENQRQAERRARWPHGTYDNGGLRRHHTIDEGQRWYDGRRRHDWR